MNFQEYQAAEQKGDILPGDEDISAQRCPDCFREGRGIVMMPYKGFFYSMQTVCVEEFTEDDIIIVDRRIRCPYDVWVCEHGHVMTDGY